MLWITNKNVNLLTLWRKIKFKKIIIIMDLSHVAEKRTKYYTCIHTAKLKCTVVLNRNQAYYQEF